MWGTEGGRETGGQKLEGRNWRAEEKLEGGRGSIIR